MEEKSLDKLMSSRRSIRKYFDKPVEETKISKVLEAVRLAPSACNAQPWRLIVVNDIELKNGVVEQGLGGVVPNSWASTAPVVIVVCSDLSLFTHRLGEFAQGVQYHLIDIGIALEHLVLKATELDLGTCYIGWFKQKPIKKLLNMPSSWNVECLITVGYPAEIPDLTKRKHLEQIAFYNKIN